MIIDYETEYDNTKQIINRYVETRKLKVKTDHVFTIGNRRILGTEIKGGLFDLGVTLMTDSVSRWVTDPDNELFETDFKRSFVEFCLMRHACGDFGILTSCDWLENENALKEGWRVMSVFDYPMMLINSAETHREIWIITEADRSVTTVLFPSDY